MYNLPQHDFHRYKSILSYFLQLTLSLPTFHVSLCAIFPWSPWSLEGFLGMSCMNRLTIQQHRWMFKHFNIPVGMDSFLSFFKQTININSCSTLLPNPTTKGKSLVLSGPLSVILTLRSDFSQTQDKFNWMWIISPLSSLGPVFGFSRSRRIMKGEKLDWIVNKLRYRLRRAECFRAFLSLLMVFLCYLTTSYMKTNTRFVMADILSNHVGVCLKFAPNEWAFVVVHAVCFYKGDRSAEPLNLAQMLPVLKGILSYE